MQELTLQFDRFCIDAIHEAAYKQYFPDIKAITKLRVKEVHMSYVDQAVPHEHLDIHVWADPTQQYKLHCQINKSSKPIFYFTVLYYEN